MQNLMTAKQFNAQFTGSVEIPARPQIFPLTGKLRCHAKVTTHEFECELKIDPAEQTCGCRTLQCENNALPNNYDFALPVCEYHLKMFRSKS